MTTTMMRITRPATTTGRMDASVVSSVVQFPPVSPVAVGRARIAWAHRKGGGGVGSRKARLAAGKGSIMPYPGIMTRSMRKPIPGN